jgi:exopolysaccharide production protein ExoQ
MVGATFPASVTLRRHGLLLSSTVGFIYAFRVCLTFLWFQDSPSQGTIVSVGLSIGLLATALLYTVISEPLQGHRPPMPRTLRYIFGYLALAFLSLSWTSTHSIPVALSYWIAMCADVLTVVLLLCGRDVEQEANQLMRGFVVGSVVVAAIAWCAPAMDDLRLGNEDFLHPNAIGFEFAIATLFTLYLSREGTRWRWLGAALGITLLRTLSKASILAFLAAAGFYVLRDSSVRRRTRLLLGFGATAVLATFLSLIDAYIEQYAQGSQLETLTGRTLIWSESLDIALEKPLLGHGFYSYRWVVPPFGVFEAWQAHDELLQQFFSYGLVGILLTVALYWSFFRQLRQHPANRLRTLALSLLIFALIRGLVDTDIFGLSFPLWLMAALTIGLEDGRWRGETSGAYLT